MSFSWGQEVRLSNPRQSLKSKYPDIRETLSKIQHTLGWSDALLAEHLGLTKKAFQDFLLEKKTPNLYTVGNFVEKIGLSVDRVATGVIDYQALGQHASGNIFYLPEHFSVAAFSKRRTSVNLLQYLEDHYDWKLKRNVLNHFQVKDAVFSNADEDVNIRFPAELCEYLVKSGYPQSMFYEMGAYSFVTNKKTVVGKTIASFGTPTGVYEGVMLGIAGKTFDRNCRYRILKMDEDECWIEAVYTDEVKDLLHRDKVANEHVCAIRGGTFASLVGYLDVPFSLVKEVKCIHKGDESCLYQVDYREAHFVQRLRQNSHAN